MTDAATAGAPRWRLLTPPSSPGAVAIIGIESPDSAAIDAALGALGLAPLPVGGLTLRTLAGRERAIVARWSATCLHLMIHGGAAVVREMTAWLVSAGLSAAREPDPVATYPEARDRVEALMLHALARAQSPLAINLLLDQPRRWRGAPADAPTAPAVLARLIDPPLVVAIGPSNIGKSTLVNALAGRSVSIVADEPGTTRDHVGVTLDLEGLVVRYADTPGLRQTSDPIERESQRLSLGLRRHADLILLMGDAASAPIPLEDCFQETLRVALRADLGTPAWPHDVAVSSRTGQGITSLVSAIRNRLVPQGAMSDPRPWAFWTGFGMESRGIDP